jgi:hypothetical protein
VNRSMGHISCLLPLNVMQGLLADSAFGYDPMTNDDIPKYAGSPNDEAQRDRERLAVVRVTGQKAGRT